MTNYEHYREQIEKFAKLTINFALTKDNKEIVKCAGFNCKNCVFYCSTGCCDDNKIDWADAEYIEPEIDWSKVAVDTPILVSLDGVEWEKRHFAEYINGHVRAWKDGRTSWITKNVSDWTYAKLVEK